MVKAQELRGGAALVIAALMAQGSPAYTEVLLSNADMKIWQEI